MAIQVCWHLSEENREREFGGLVEACNAFSGLTGYLLTLNQEELPMKDIRVMPVWKWILER